MSDFYYFLGSMFGLAVGLIIFYSIGAKRRVKIPLSAWWACIVAGVIACGYSLSHSTGPSFAPRATVVGKTSDCVKHRMGKSSKYSFLLSPLNGKPIFLETHLIIPSWALPEVFNGRVFRVVYLQDAERSVSNEAIDIEILSGRHAGWHDSFDARPFGVWLGIPIGAMIGSFGLFGVRFRDNDAESGQAEEST